jgi:hypothetical protein
LGTNDSGEQKSGEQKQACKYLHRYPHLIVIVPVVVTGPVIVTPDDGEMRANVALTAQALFGIKKI